MYSVKDHLYPFRQQTNTRSRQVQTRVRPKPSEMLEGPTIPCWVIKKLDSNTTELVQGPNGPKDDR
jgi:hypothetical protein